MNKLATTVVYAALLLWCVGNMLYAMTTPLKAPVAIANITGALAVGWFLKNAG